MFKFHRCPSGEGKKPSTFPSVLLGSVDGACELKDRLTGEKVYFSGTQVMHRKKWKLKVVRFESL